MVWSISRSSVMCALAAAHSRSSWNCIIWNMKPMPSWPIRLRCGTRTSSKKSWPVSELFMPIFLILCLLMPGASIGTMIRLLFLCGGASLVLASRQHQSACSELVIHILLPSIT